MKLYCLYEVLSDSVSVSYRGRTPGCCTGGPQCTKVSAAGRLYLKPSFKLLFMLDDINRPLTLLVHLLQDIVEPVTEQHRVCSVFFFAVRRR